MRRLVLLAVCLSLPAAPGSAATLHVKPDAPGPAHDGTSWQTAFLTIQGALDAAAPGDAIWVASSTYPENVAFTQPRLALYGGFRGAESSLDQRTPGAPSVLTGPDTGAPVVSVRVEASGAVLDGFTVTREASSPEPGIRCVATGVTLSGDIVWGCGQVGMFGGIVFWPSSSAVVQDCHILGNVGRAGGGIRAVQATVVIRRCRITNNTAEDILQTDYARSGLGGGIASEGSTLTVEDSLIADNVAWEGGGVFLGGGTATVLRTDIIGNTADRLAPEWTGGETASRGGGILAWGVDGEIRQCVIARNHAFASRAFGAGIRDARAEGGGISVPTGTVDLVNNTIVRNIAHTPSYEGTNGALHYGIGGDVESGVGEGTLANNIIAFNADDVPGWFDNPSFYFWPRWTLRANLIYGNEPRIEPSAYGAGNEMMGDPDLVDGYHLGSRSAAIDKGEIGFVLPGETDHDGKPRIQGRRVDAGAYEFTAPPGPSRVYVSTSGDDAADGLSWATAKRTIDAGLAEAGLDGEVWVARGVYEGHPTLWSRVALYGGFTGNETDHSARDVRINTTVLDGGKFGPVVSIQAFLHDVTIDGFTITNGERRWEAGAGIASYGRDITLSNNIIEKNLTWDLGSYVYSAGGGIFASGGPITVARNVIRDNRAAASQDGPPQFANMAYASGGGMVLSEAVVTVVDNLFVRNMAIAGGYGNVGASGSAISAGRITGLIANNTFVENGMPRSDGWRAAVGEAISMMDCPQELIVTNNIIAFNAAGISVERSAPVLRNNAFFANTRGNVSGIPDPIGTSGNISADSFFVDGAGGDYRLSVGSPLIDAGDDSVVQPGQTDLGGIPRIIGAHADIGAYEFVPTSGLTLGHAAWALRVAAGLTDSTPSALAILDVAADSGAVDMRDAIAIARRVATDWSRWQQSARSPLRGLSLDESSPRSGLGALPCHRLQSVASAYNEALSAGGSGRTSKRRKRKHMAVSDIARPAAWGAANLEAVDPEIAAAIRAEERREEQTLELIASENFTSPEVLACQGSVLTNKYAEGYPGKRYYGGCEFVDVAETLAIQRAKELFGAEHANVQPHSGSQANMAVYLAMLQPGDTVMGMDLSMGGHLTHGHPLNFSGKLFNIVSYGLTRDTEVIDYDDVLAKAKEHQPKMIIAGASAYSRIIDFAKFREIADEVGALLMVDMAHIAGLVAAGIHPSPVPHADFVTSTTHKTLRGPRAGMILCKEEYAAAIDRMVLPGIQGGPLMHVIAAKAVCFKQAMSDEFKAYQGRVVSNMQALAEGLKGTGVRIVSGGTDNHLALVDLTPIGISGKKAETSLDAVGITVNKNMIPFDTRKALVTSGIRVGTAAVTTRGMGEAEMGEIAGLIGRSFQAGDDEDARAAIRKDVNNLCARFPLYTH